MAAMLLCASAFASHAGPDATRAGFYSFADLVHLTAGMDAVPPSLPGLLAIPARAVESASAGASRPVPYYGTPQTGRTLAVHALGSAAAAAAPQVRFSVHELPRPQPGLLALSGLAAAFWVARRRLRYPIHG